MTPPLLTEEEGPPILKELNPGVIYANTSPHIGSCGWAGSHHLLARSASPPRPGCAQAPNYFTLRRSVPDRYYQSRGLGKQWHLVPGRIGHSHRHPRALNSKHLSVGIHPVTAEHSHSTKGTCTIALITLTLARSGKSRLLHEGIGPSGTRTVNTMSNILS
jgi:hypothetical protein